MPETLSEIFARLSIAENDEKKRILRDMRPLVTDLQGCSEKTVENLNLEIVFAYLKSATDEEDINLACETLGGLLSFLKPSMILERYSDVIIAGLDEKSDKSIKILILKTLQRTSSTDLLLSNHCVLCRATLCVGDQELSVSKEATKLLSFLSVENPEIIISSPVYPLLQEMISDRDETIQLRIYELFLEVVPKSQNVLKSFIDTRTLNKLLELVFSNDVLVKLNALEVLSNLACTPEGFQFIVKDSGISLKLDELFIGEDSLYNLYLPGIIRFFGKIASFDPRTVLKDHPRFYNTLYSNLSDPNTNEDFQIICAETLGLIARHHNGKEVLDEKFNVKESLSLINKFIVSGKTEMRVRAIEVFAELVDGGSSRERDWFLTLQDNSKSSTGVLLDILKLPFDDLAEAGLKLMYNISQYEWGATLISKQPGFVTHLLDRKALSNKQAKDVKYEIIKNLLNVGDSNTLVTIFGTPSVIKMKQYVRDGPYYVNSQVEVAYEEA